MEKYTCPCCGYVVFTEKPGSHQVCPVCKWEDDVSQLKFVTALGANFKSLLQAQNDCVVDESNNDLYKKDESWRKIDKSIDHIIEPIDGHDYGSEYSNDLTELYYWKIE